MGKECGLWLCVPGIRAAEPLEYLSRVVLFNRLFSDDIQIEGVISEPAREAIVTSQPTIRGAPTTPLQVREGMEEFGFVLSDFPPLGRSGVASQTFFHPGERVAVFDTHAANFVVKEGKVVPIDALVTTMDESLERCLAMPMTQRRKEVGLQTAQILGW